MSAPIEQLANNYLAGSDELRKAVSGLSHDQLVARPIPRHWSSLEVICHIADFEAVFADRMKRIIALEDPLLLVADENLFLEKLRYHERDAEEELTLIEVTRRQMARILRSLTPEQFMLTGVHSKKGLVTLEKVTHLAINHIAHHLPFIAEKRKALGA